MWREKNRGRKCYNIRCIFDKIFLELVGKLAQKVTRNMSEGDWERLAPLYFSLCWVLTSQAIIYSSVPCCLPVCFIHFTSLVTYFFQGKQKRAGVYKYISRATGRGKSSGVDLSYCSNISTLNDQKNLECILISHLYKEIFLLFYTFKSTDWIGNGCGESEMNFLRSSFFHQLFLCGASHLLGQQLKARANKHL